MSRCEQIEALLLRLPDGALLWETLGDLVGLGTDAQQEALQLALERAATPLPSRYARENWWRFG